VTTSIDGHVELWKNKDQGIEFVKHCRAHTSVIVGISASSDGQLFTSVSEDGNTQVFDTLNYGYHYFHHRALSTLTGSALLQT
jgi:peptidylprolyl isomerase domain and WD repeat-containing protein 1